MRKALKAGDRVVHKHTGKHGVILDREEPGGGLGFISVRVKFDGEQKPEWGRMSLSTFRKEKAR